MRTRSEKSPLASAMKPLPYALRVAERVHTLLEALQVLLAAQNGHSARVVGEHGHYPAVPRARGGLTHLTVGCAA